jgi:hypothetical protein
MWMKSGIEGLHPGIRVDEQEALMVWRMGSAMFAGMLGLLLTAGTAGAANWADGLLSENGHDFGPVPRGAKVRHNFLLTNRLAEPITIVNVRASCGCTSGKANASLVPPGQQAVVEAEMDTRNFVGAKSTTLFVSLFTASGKEAEVRLGVSAMILSDIVLNPGAIDFGAVARGQTPSQILTIDRIGLPGWRAQRMVSSSRVLEAKLVEAKRTGDSVGYLLTVSLKPGTPAGVVRDEIRILTNDPEAPSIPIQVTALIRGELSASPSLLSLGRVASAAPVQGRFLVRASKPFAIRSVEGAGDGFQVEPVEPGSRTVHVVTISYHSEESRVRGDLRHAFRVVTDLPGEGPLELTATLHVD